MYLRVTLSSRGSERCPNPAATSPWVPWRSWNPSLRKAPRSRGWGGDGGQGEVSLHHPRDSLQTEMQILHGVKEFTQKQQESGNIHPRGIPEGCCPWCWQGGAQGCQAHFWHSSSLLAPDFPAMWESHNSRISGSFQLLVPQPCPPCVWHWCHSTRWAGLLWNSLSQAQVAQPGAGRGEAGLGWDGAQPSTCTLTPLHSWCPSITPPGHLRSPGSCLLLLLQPWEMRHQPWHGQKRSCHSIPSSCAFHQQLWDIQALWVPGMMPGQTPLAAFPWCWCFCWAEGSGTHQRM